MLVRYWGVGASTPSNLPMTTSDVSGQLAVDWVPSLPASVSSSFVGWPPYLIQLVNIDGSDFLALGGEAGRTERQWKGVLSWMLGVAGARHLLESEGYRWVAPLSAFYRNAAGSVDLTGWNDSFPPSSIVADRAPGSLSRLRPDYIALRPIGPEGDDHYDWAVAEAKGTSRSLSNLPSCPSEWFSQSRNVKLEHNGTPLTIQRHLVVATRVNPKASRPESRLIQLRAWNSQDDPARTALPIGAAVDVASAHLFGLFRTLRLRENARALALSTRARYMAHSGEVPIVEGLDGAAARAADELRERTRPRKQEDATEAAVTSIETDFGAIEVEIASPTLELAQELQRSQNDDTAQAALRKADRELDKWLMATLARPQEPDKVSLSAGVRLQLPHELIEVGQSRRAAALARIGPH